MTTTNPDAWPSFIERPRQLRLSITATVIRRPGRRSVWTATYGPWGVEGASEKAATERLIGNITDFLAQYQDPIIMSFRGLTTVISAALGHEPGQAIFASTTVDAAGNRAGSSYTHHAGGWDEAVADARYNLAQRTTEWLDDASVHEAATYVGHPDTIGDRYGADELYRYAAWQRAARCAIVDGRSDWHEWATMHATEYAVSRPEES